jgi:vacuolar-type H+-ATPase subunit I/STV1
MDNDVIKSSVEFKRRSWVGEDNVMDEIKKWHSGKNPLLPDTIHICIGLLLEENERLEEYTQLIMADANEDKKELQSVRRQLQQLREELEHSEIINGELRLQVQSYHDELEQVKVERDKWKQLTSNINQIMEFQAVELAAKDKILNLIADEQWHPNCDMVNVEIPYEMRMRARSILSRYENKD